MGGPAPYWHSYTYDEVGNRLTETLHEQDTERTYAYPEPGTPQPHTLTSVIEEAPGVRSLEEYAYDAGGNTIARQTGGDTQELTWDAEGRLARVEEANGEVTEYLYDADGNRLIGRTPTGTTLYLGDHTEVTLPTGSAIPTATRYFDLGGGHTAVIADDESVSITMADHHGTGQLAIATDTLELTQRRTLPFGNLRGDTPDTWAGTRGFVGGTTDTATGLTHLGAREYDPGLGRFISLDPVMDLTDPQQIHGYTYANNNPVTYSDPTGLFFGGLLDKIRETVSNVSNTAQKAVGNYRRSSNRGGGSSTISRISWPADARDQCTVEVPCGYPGDSETRWQAEMERREGSIPDRVLGFFTSLIFPDPEAWEGCVGERSGEDCVWAATDLPWGKALRVFDEVQGLVGNAVRRGSRCAGSNSFLPETHVLMADGTTKAVEDLEIGEEILATDPATGETGPRTVTAELTNSGDKDLVTLTITDTQGNTHSLTSTAEHPYWTPGHGQWLNAADLHPGTHLHTDTGTQARVTTTDHWTTSTTVHNLTIEGLHTYYVLGGTTPVLVHNSGGCKEVVLERFDTFEQARNEALELLGEIDPATRQPYIGRLESSSTTYGRVVGFTTRVNGEFKRFRMDYDPVKGPHINVEIGRGDSARKWAVPWSGTEEDFARMLDGIS
ncbi:polymorphic toxin-type HINT domain-containing protein [Streptomyces sp. MP131-18]|uniref:polymorphic toxin-type HINT domain-containing protein n=1 Tax=Streptomyces sp. MP131-18 TaxID=1857892 RepID=UPI00344F07B8